MMSRLPRNPKEKEKIGFWLLNPASKIESLLLIFFFLLLPTQFGKHLWPDFTVVSGIRIDYLSPVLYASDIIITLLLGAFVFRWLQQRLDISTGSSHQAKESLKKTSHSRNAELARIKHIGKRHVFFLSFICIFIITNIVFAYRPLLSFYGWIKFLELLFLVLYLSHVIRYRYQVRFIAVLFAISGIFESLLAILQYLNQGSLNGIFYFFGERNFTGSTPGIANASINGALILRPYATFSHPNVLAGFLLFAMVLVWSFCLKTKRRWVKVIGSFSLLVSSIALLLTYSRVAILLWIVGIFLLLFRKGFYEVKRLKVKIIFILIALVVLFAASFFPLTHELYDRFIHTSLLEESVTERTELLSASWIMIQQHPLNGVGLLNFIPSLAPLQKPLPLGLYLQPVHNIFGLVIVETGIIGFGLFIWLLAVMIQRIRKQDPEIRNTFFVLLIIIFVTGFFDHYWLTLQQGQLLFATIIGLSRANFEKTT